MNKIRFFYQKQLNWHILRLIWPLFVFAACSPSPAPPRPEIVAGVYVHSGYEFYRWEEGLALMIWHDGTKSSECASSTNERGFMMRCQAISEDNVHFDWKLETDDGKTADLKFNDASFDLEDGALFVITRSDGETQVRQLKRDLSAVDPNADGVVEFGLTEPAIRDHLQVSPIKDDCISSSNSASQGLGKADPQLAHEALTAFFTHLHAGEYERAAEYYGGSYDGMQDHNPDIDPVDQAALFRNTCTINGAKCLTIHRATLLEHASPAEYRFVLQFANKDGSLFTRGPCCGDEDVNGSQQDEFLYTVRLDCTGRYLVMDMPVYVP